MQKQTNMEVWLRGPVPDVIPLLQPVAHALLQAQEEIHVYMEGIDEMLMWQRPAGVASIAFHLQHICGFLDRLFTYAEGQQLSKQQLGYLSKEGVEDGTLTVRGLCESLDTEMQRCLTRLKNFQAATLEEPRFVGRKMIPSTVIGLLVHAAEHTQRHTGQLLVTSRILQYTQA